MITREVISSLRPSRLAIVALIALVAAAGIAVVGNLVAGERANAARHKLDESVSNIESEVGVTRWISAADNNVVHGETSDAVLYNVDLAYIGQSGQGCPIVDRNDASHWNHLLLFDGVENGCEVFSSPNRRPALMFGLFVVVADVSMSGTKEHHDIAACFLGAPLQCRYFDEAPKP